VDKNAKKIGEEKGELVTKLKKRKKKLIIKLY